MSSNKHHFYFITTVIAILATSSFVMLEIMDTMTDIDLIEGSFYGVVRNGDVRLSAEIKRGIEEIDLNTIEKEFKEISEEINNL